MKQKIWIDCDPGIDDAVAITLASACQDQLEILGISTVAGNQTLERVTENARKLTSFLGISQVPVAKGANGPLVRIPKFAGYVHGKTGIGNYCLPETDKQVEKDHAVVVLARRLASLPPGEKVTLVPMGPLTNIALLLRVFPEVAEHIDKICLMGGAAVGGNVTPTGEFNIWADPEAAQIVFTCGLPIVMCGLDVTNLCGLTREQARSLKERVNPVTRMVGELVEFYFQSPVYQGRELAAIHDAVTITYLLHPDWFTGRDMRVEVDCSEERNRGMTVCDFRGDPGEKHGVTVLLEVKAEQVREFWMEKLW
ncbi:MAG: nucleoside hydrolase [Lachnospiraceae bacterium]|nr:nucleoside hydrolase [Lachnospiraceae bacterium]